MILKNKSIIFASLFVVAALCTITGSADAAHIDSADKIEQQINSVLTNSTYADEVQQQAIDQAWNILYGRTVILNTTNVIQTSVISAAYDTRMSNINDDLLSCINGNCSDGTVASNAKRLLDTNYNFMEIKEQLEIHTSDSACDASTPTTTCTVLAKNEEPLTDTTTTSVDSDDIWTGFEREIRSPFFQNPTHTSQQENIIIPTSGGLVSSNSHTNYIDGGAANSSGASCAVVVKEIQGVKSILRATELPVYQAPFNSTTSIVEDEDIVWVIDFVPGEFVKTLTYCVDKDGVLSIGYDIQMIVERQLTHFWMFLNPGNMQ